jgi:hypothetical protein
VTHFHDEELIAHLNDADGSWKKRRIRRHLASCLECRYRLNCLDEELRRIIAAAHVLRQAEVPATEHAKELFRERIAREPAQPLGRRIREKSVFVWATVAVAAVLFSVVWGLSPRAPGDALAKARSIEDRSLSRSGIRQEFELRWSGPNAAPAEPRRIEVMYDPRGKRLSLAWRNTNGVLTYGLWRPSPNRAMEYYPAEGDGVRPLRPGNSSAESGTVNVERSLVRWFEKRDAAPIRLSREGILTPSLVTLGRPGEVRDDHGRLILEWRTSAMKDISLLTLSLKTADYRPVSQTLHSQTAGVEIELRLLSETAVSPDRITRSTFEPSPLLIMSRNYSEPGNSAMLPFTPATFLLLPGDRL